MNELLEGLIARVAQAENGDRPAALRAFGDAAALLDAAEWIDTRSQVVKRLKIKLAEVDALRADGRKAAEEAERAKAALTAAAAGETETAPGYVISQGVAGTPFLAYRKMTPDGPMLQTLARFVPRVVGERVRHKADGTITRVMALELTTARGPHSVEVEPDVLADARRFYAACIQCIGADAKLANAGAMKHLPLAAFDLADNHRARSEVYEFVGWHEHAGSMVYLSAAGAIGTEQALTVDLAGLARGAGVESLVQFGPVDRGDESFRAGLAALAGPVRRCFPDLVTLPGIAAAFLAPLLRLAPAIDRPAVHYIGATGARKSAWLGILQAFYGLAEPALSWRGTANSIEIALSALRDALVTVDDLKAATSDRDAGVKIIQAYADRRGRSRATRSGDLARARFVGGLLVSAGEDIPSGEASVAGRSLFVPVGAGDANLDALTAAQAAAPHLATIAARFIGYVIAGQETIKAAMAERFVRARDHYRRLLGNSKGINDAGRVAVNCALLDVATGAACEWLYQTCGWTRDDAGEWVYATRKALETLAIQQAQAIGEESAAGAFVTALRALLDSRRGEVVKLEAGVPLSALSEHAPKAANGVMIGWQRANELILQPELALAEVRRWLSSQGRALPTERGLYAQLRDGGWLAEVGDRTTVARWVGGKTQRVLVLRSERLYEPETPEEKAEKNTQ